MRALLLGSGPDLTPWSLCDFPTSPVVEWHRGNLIAAGIRDLRIIHSDFPANTLGMMVEATDWLLQEDSLILESDQAFSPSLLRAMAAGTGDIELAYQPSRGSRTLTGEHRQTATGLKIECRADGMLSNVLPQRTRAHRESGFSLGLWRMTPRGWRSILELLAELDEEERHRMALRGLLSRLVRKGVPIRVIPVPGGWRVLGDPETILLDEARPTRRGDRPSESAPNRLAA